MREILFRGKRKDNGEWIYGDLFRNHDGRVFVGELVVTDYKGQADDRYELGVGFEEVEPLTVTRFINAIDKNEKKLFEGDIVNVYRKKGDAEPNRIAIIVDDSTLIEDGLGRWMPQDTVLVEIVGNIFDNLELLSDKNNRWIKHYWDWPEGVYNTKWAY